MGEPSQIDQLIQAVLSGKGHALEDLYAQHRSSFFRWAGRRFVANRQDLEDAWQDAITAFYQQVISGKLVHLRSDVRTWLFAVGYKRLLNQHRKVKRLLWKDPTDKALALYNDDPGPRFDHSIQQEQLQAAMNQLSAQCRELLVQRYFQEQSIQEIQEAWDFNSANTTSSTLSRCLSRLKELLKKDQVVNL